MNIQQIRAQFPQYSDLSDKQLADALHAKFYSDIPIGDYYKRIGFAGDTNRTFSEAATDVGAALLRGTGQALQFPGQLVGLVPGMQGLGEALATPGGALAEYGQGLKSAGLRAREALRNQALSDAEKEGFLAEFATAIGQTIKDPALLSTFLLEQVPQLIGPAAAAKVTTMLGREGLQAVAEGGAREAAEKALRERAAAAAVGTGAAAQGASIGDETYKAVYELALQQGMSEEDARALALEKARIAAFEAGAISVATSRLPGGAAIERRLAGLPGVPGAGRIGVGAREALTEGLEEAGGAFAKGVGVAEVDPSISPLTGVGTAAGFGVLGGAGLGTFVGGSPTAEQRAASEAEAPINRLKREAAEKAQAEERARAEPVNRAQAVIDETAGLPLGQAFPRLTREIEALRQQPKSPERDAAVKALTEERRRRQTNIFQQIAQDRQKAEGFLTQAEAAEEGTVPRGQFDPIQARRDEIARLRQQRDALLVKGKPPAPKSPARKQFDELDARLLEIGGGRWTPGTAPTAPTAPTGAEAPPEPTVRVAQGPKPLPDVLDSETVKTIGFVRGKIHDALVGKSITDPEVRAVLEGYKQGKNASAKTVAKIDAFLGRLPEPVTPPAAEAVTPTPAPPVPETSAAEAVTPTETPSATTTEPATGGAGVPVVAGPPTVEAPGGAGVVEPTGVVPSTPDAGQPVAGEGEQPGAVTAPAPAPEPAKPPKAAEPEYTEEDIDRAVELGIFTEEQAEMYRAELRDEAPQTAMGLAFERQIADIKARMDALRQKNGRAPAPKSPKRKEYDALKAQLDALVTAETGDLATKLEKMGASGVVGTRGERPVIDLDAVKENLLRARAQPSMYQAVLAYIGVDTDGNYLPTTYSREEAAELAGLGRGSGANVSRVAQAMGIDAEAISRFHAGQTDIIVRGKNVSEAGTGATDLQPSKGVLYEAPKKNKPGRAVGFLRDALTETGTLDFSKLSDKQVADIYARASNYDPKRGSNEEVIKQLNAEIAARVKADRKGMQNALDRAYRVVRTEEEAQQEPEVEGDVEEDVEPTVREGRTGARRLEGEEKASLEEEEADESQYRTVPQSPVVTDRISDAELNKIVSDIGKALGGKLDITILDDVIDVDNKQAPGSRAGALIRGKIYLFRSGIAKGIEGQKTIFHEVFHKGLRNLLPPAEYRALMTKFYNQSAAVREMADAYLASETGKADTKGLSPQDARVLAVEEALAEMAETTDLSGSALRQLGNFFARLADRFGMPNLARAIRTMGMDPLQSFIREAIQAGIRPSVGEGVTRFREIEKILPTQIGQFGPIKNASVRYFLQGNSVFAQVLDQDLVNSGVKPSRAVVDQFDLDILEDGKRAEVHTFGIPPSASAVLSKYKGQYNRVKPTRYSAEPLYKFTPGSFSNKDIRYLIRNLRGIAVREKIFDKVETVVIKRGTGATAGSPPREIGREAAMRFRTTPKPGRPEELVSKKEEGTLGDYLGRTLGERKTIGIRALMMDSLASVEAKLGEAYGEKIRDMMGDMNPVVLLSRALDSVRFAAEMLNVGKMVVDPSGMTRLTTLSHNGQNISYASVMRDVKAEAERRGMTGEALVKEIGEVLAGRREYELMRTPDAASLEFFLTPQEAQAANNRFNNDAFIKDVSEKLDAIRFAGIDFLVATGRIPESKAKEWKDATGYIPFKRIDEMDKLYADRGGGVPSDLKLAAFKGMGKFTGSDERQTENPLENFVSLMEWMTREGMKAEAVGRALNDMVLIGAAKRVPTAQAVADNQKGAVVSSWENGKQKFYLVPDPADFAAFAGFKASSVAGPIKAMQQVSKVLRIGVTATPAFAIKQIFDDITRAYVHSGVKNPAALVPRMLLEMPKAWWAEVRGLRTPGMEMLARHGVVPTYDTIEGGNVRNIFEETGISKRSMSKAILRIIEAGAKASDIATRQAIFDQTMKETGDVDLAEQRAREIINFSRKGASSTADFFIRTVPFFNAYARSMDKLLLAAAGNPAMQKTLGMSTGYARNLFFKRMGVLTAAGLAYAMLMSDDEDYQDLPDNVRDRNWVLPYGKELGFTPVIPLPAELAFFFKAIPERVVQYVKLQGTPEERDALTVAKEMLLAGVDLFSTPNLTPQLVKPFYENLVNYSFFLGRPLESQAQLALDPSKRYGTSTSEAIKAGTAALSEAGIEISPIMVENAVRGVLGMSAGLAISVADALVNPSRTDRPLHQQVIPQLTGASALMKDPVGNRFLDDIYDLDKKVEQAYNTYKKEEKDDPEKANAYYLRTFGLQSIREEMKGVMNAIREMNAQARAIDKMTDIPSEERAQLIADLKSQQNELARISYALRRRAALAQMEADR